MGRCAIVSDVTRDSKLTREHLCSDTSWGAASKPKSLLEKARNQTMKATSVYRSTVSSPSTSRASSSSSSAAAPRPRPPTLLRPTPSSVNPGPTPPSRYAQSQAHGRLLQDHMSASGSKPPTNLSPTARRIQAPTTSSPGSSNSSGRPPPYGSHSSPPMSMADLIIGRSSGGKSGR